MYKECCLSFIIIHNYLGALCKKPNKINCSTAHVPLQKSHTWSCIAPFPTILQKVINIFCNPYLEKNRRGREGRIFLRNKSVVCETRPKKFDHTWIGKKSLVFKMDDCWLAGTYSCGGEQQVQASSARGLCCPC